MLSRTFRTRGRVRIPTRIYNSRRSVNADRNPLQRSISERYHVHDRSTISIRWRRESRDRSRLQRRSQSISRSTWPMKTDPRLLLLTLVRAQRIFVSVPSFTRSFRNLTSNLPCWWAASWRRWSPKDISQQVRHWSATDVTSLVQSLLTNSSICFAWTHICIPLPSNQEDLVTTTFQNFDSHFSATRVEVPWQLYSRFMYQIYSDSFHIVLTSIKYKSRGPRFSALRRQRSWLT